MRSPCPNCGKTTAHLPSESAFCTVGCNLDYLNSAPPAVQARTIARQARTIRRLFTAYFLAKGKLRRKEEVHRMVTRLAEFLAKEGERARIVAALRAKAASAIADIAPSDATEAEGVNLVITVLREAADAIERGEL